MAGLMSKSERVGKRKKQAATARDVAAKGTVIKTVDDEGISAEERQDILKEIEQITAGQRIKVQSDTFETKAEQRGIALPSLVNIVMVGLLALLLPLLWLFFNRQQRDIGTVIALDTSAESALIQQIRDQYEAELADQEDSLSAIQQQLTDVESRRTELAGSVGQQVTDRRRQLEIELEQRLLQERARLESLSLTVADLEARLATFESAEQAEIERRLADFQADLASQQQQLVDELDRQESQFQNELNAALQQRDLLTQNVRQNELELRRQADAAAAGEVSAARERLQDLTRIQDLELQFNNGISGFYNSIVAGIDRGDLDGARRNLDLLSAYLNQSVISDLPTIGQRRATDLEIIAALEALIDQIATGDTDATGLVAERNRQTAAAATLYSRAQGSLRGGETTQALESYLTIVEDLPQSQQLQQVPDELRALFNSRNTGYEARIAQMEQRINELETEISLADSGRLSSESRQEDLATTVTTLQQQLNARNADQRRYVDLQSSYEEYIARVDELGRDDTPITLLASASALDDLFLLEDVVQESFPSLRTDIQNYFRANEQEGIQQATDLIGELIQSTDRSATIARRRSGSINDPIMAALLENLSRLVEQ